MAASERWRAASAPRQGTGNQLFHDSLGAEGLAELARASGLLGCPDLDRLRGWLGDRFASSSSEGCPHVLEIGGGYGRAVAWLGETFPAARVTVVESCGGYIEALRACFGGRVGVGKGAVRIVPLSVLEAPLPEHVDAALWLWGGIGELTWEERRRAFRRLARSLAPTGQLAIDVPVFASADAASSADAPDAREIARLALANGLVVHDTLAYTVDASAEHPRARILYLVGA
jgi:hypothetical protein